MSDTRSWIFRLKHWWNRRSEKTQVRIVMMFGVIGVPSAGWGNILFTGVSTPEKLWGDAFLFGLVGLIWFALEIRWLWRKAIYGD